MDRYIFIRTTDKQRPLAENSTRQYKSYASTLAHEFPVPVSQLTAQHVALWRDLNGRRPSYVNGCIALGTGAYRKANEWGLCRHNPFNVQGFVIAARERRITQLEFDAVRAQAPEWLQIAMDLAYMTAARPVDIRSLRWDRITDEGVYIQQQKTGMRQLFAMTDELSAVLARAKARRILGLFVVADHKGRSISKNKLEDAMREAVQSAGVQDMTFRDIRPQAATDAEESGRDAQPLLGHARRAQTDHYVRRRKTIKVEPLMRKKV